MKSIHHSSLWVVSLLLVGNLLLSSCDKDKDNPESASIPLIATAKSYDQNGELNYSESYQYDNQGRVIKMDDNDDYHSMLEYSASTITVKDYQGEELEETTIFTLNDKGLCTSVLWGDSEEAQIYDYDSNGYRKSTTDQGDFWVSTVVYTVSEGNYVTILSTDQTDTENSALIKELSFLKSASPASHLLKRFSLTNRLKSAVGLFTEKSDYQFFTDKTNTIEYENMGITFFGKQNKNPIKQETTTYTYDGEVAPTQTITYTYEYDAKGRITKQTSNDGDYSVYTYID